MTRVLALLRGRFQARAHERQADRLFRQGDFVQSVDQYQAAVRLSPGRPLALFNLGMALYKSGQRVEAREYWQAALALAEGRHPYLEEQIRIALRQFG